MVRHRLRLGHSSWSTAEGQRQKWCKIDCHRFCEACFVQRCRNDQVRPAKGACNTKRAEGATDQAGQSYLKLAAGRINLLQFVEVRQDLSVVSQENLLGWYQRGLGLLGRPNQPDIDLMIPVLLDEATMNMTLIALQVKNQAAGSRPTDGKVRAPAIAQSSVPRLFLWMEMNGTLQEGIKAGQYHFEAPVEQDPSQTKFFVCGDVLHNLGNIFGPLAIQAMEEDFGALLRAMLDASAPTPLTLM